MKRTILFILLSYSHIVVSQDLHFSQFFRVPIFLNPALTGGINEEMRVMAIARNQWQSIPVPYNSFGMSVDGRILMPKAGNDKIGVGLQVLGDRAGDSKFTTLQASVAGAYHYMSNSEQPFDLSIGINGTYYNRRYDPNLLNFDNQFNGDYFDPNIPIDEQLNRLSLSFFDFGVGTNLLYPFSKNSSLNIGTSVQHLGSSEQSFLINSDNALLQTKWNFYGYGSFQVYKNLGLMPLFFYQTQDKKQEMVLGLGLNIDLEPKIKHHHNLILGLSMRVQDALIPWLNWEYGNFSLQFSYDFNTSPLRIATNSYGGAELSLGIKIKGQKEKKRDFRECPYLWF